MAPNGVSKQSDAALRSNLSFGHAAQTPMQLEALWRRAVGLHDATAVHTLWQEQPVGVAQASGRLNHAQICERK